MTGRDQRCQWQPGLSWPCRSIGFGLKNAKPCEDFLPNDLQNLWCRQIWKKWRIRIKNVSTAVWGPATALQYRYHWPRVLPLSSSRLLWRRRTLRNVSWWNVHAASCSRWCLEIGEFVILQVYLYNIYCIIEKTYSTFIYTIFHNPGGYQAISFDRSNRIRSRWILAKGSCDLSRAQILVARFASCFWRGIKVQRWKKRWFGVVQFQIFSFFVTLCTLFHDFIWWFLDQIRPTVPFMILSSGSNLPIFWGDVQ